MAQAAVDSRSNVRSIERQMDMDKDLQTAIESLAQELNVNVKQITAAIELLDAGNTIPFIARYRKEVTQGLDELALRAIEDAVEKARELAARKQTVLKTIDGQAC